MKNLREDEKQSINFLISMGILSIAIGHYTGRPVLGVMAYFGVSALCNCIAYVIAKLKL